MERKKLTAKLERIIRTIEAGLTPTQVRQLWVFGSYRRGALECGDLDLALLVDPPPDQWYKERGISSWDLQKLGAFESAMRLALRSKGERIEILVEKNEEHLQSIFQSIPVHDALLLWSSDDTAWREKIDGIAINPKAGRFERGFPIDLKRTGSARDVMEKVMWLVSHGRLIMKEEPMDDVVPQIPKDIEAKLERAVEHSFAGKDTLNIVPFAYDWLRKEKQQVPPHQSIGATQITSIRGSHLVHLGRIDFGYVLGWMFNDKKAQKLCLVPHLRKRSANKMFVIEKGPQWTGEYDEIQRGPYRV